MQSHFLIELSVHLRLPFVGIVSPTSCTLRSVAQTDVSLLHAAVVAVVILEPQPHFRSVFLEVKKLFGVEGSTSLPVEEEDKWKKIN